MPPIKPLKVLSAALALGACTLSQAASAQQSCITRAELSAVAIYAVPGIIQGAQLKCGATLPASGFLRTNGAAFSSRYANVRSGVWPEARSGALKYLAAKSPDAQQNLALIANLPEETVQPLLDVMVAQETAKNLNLQDCSAVDLTLEALAPLDPRAAANLVGLAANIMAKNDLLICALDQR